MRGADRPRPTREIPAVRGENKTDGAVDVAPPEELTSIVLPLVMKLLSRHDITLLLVFLIVERHCE